MEITSKFDENYMKTYIFETIIIIKILIFIEMITVMLTEKLNNDE